MSKKNKRRWIWGIIALIALALFVVDQVDKTRLPGTYHVNVPVPDSLGGSYEYRYIFQPWGTGIRKLRDANVIFGNPLINQEWRFTYSMSNNKVEIRFSEKDVEHYIWTHGKLTRSSEDKLDWQMIRVLKKD